MHLGPIPIAEGIRSVMEELHDVPQVDILPECVGTQEAQEYWELILPQLGHPQDGPVVFRGGTEQSVDGVHLLGKKDEVQKVDT